MIIAQFNCNYKVAPLAGAWIETALGMDADELLRCRPPRGGVD